MPVQWIDGAPVDRGRPVLVVAAELLPPDGVGRLRSAVRRLARDGFTGLWLREATAAQAVVVRDTARRAGVAVIATPGLLDPAPHVLSAAADDLAVATDEVAAFTHLFAGERVIVGAEEAVEGLVGYLDLTADAAAWTALDSPAGWTLRGTATELGGFSPTGADLTVPWPADGRVLQWVDPATGLIRALVSPPAGEPEVVRGSRGPIAIYAGPNRYRADDSVTRPA